MYSCTIVECRVYYSVINKFIHREDITFHKLFCLETMYLQQTTETAQITSSVGVKSAHIPKFVLVSKP